MAHIRRVDFNEDNIASVTFNWNIANTINEYIRLYAYPSSIYVESEIEWVKLVLGNKTSLLWSPFNRNGPFVPSAQIHIICSDLVFFCNGEALQGFIAFD